ncbi:sigma-70 family RNA polymerase sigma factor [Runella sp. CRIBMP]|uniref:RNA polymerase sigma factor n=1 Tax=Runella sp. CRIBMP TaxID=2683261 RepID=UPI0014122407|nr:sigma-70 family RNA polymerase sigma factor [Runella sp. CRIBMP]NBB20448.1 sigma-70 family RNA polymerase sigma factor [Runella sp. CRIBMP]
MNVKQLDDERLVGFLREGKISAFEEIYRRYWYKLFGIAYHQTGVREEAEELVQEVFLTVWNRRTEVVIRHLDLYLTIAIKNQVYDYIKSQISYRKYQEYLIFQEIHQHYATDEIVNFSELSAAVENVLSRLPEKSAEVFKRSRFENQSVREIALGLNLSEKAVEYHITKSLKFLKENLKPFQSDN